MTGQSSTEVLYVRIPGELKVTLDDICDRTGLTLTAVAVELLSRALGEFDGLSARDRIDRALAERTTSA